MRLLTPAVLLGWLSACGAPFVPGPQDAGPGSDAGTTRPYRMAATGAQLVFPGGYLLTAANLAEDVDVISVHLDTFYGVPWDEFGSGQPPPQPWVDALDGLAAEAVDAGKPVFLSLRIGDSALSDKAVVVDGGLTRVAGWSGPCYDFSTADGAVKKAAYVRFVDWTVRHFRARWANVDIETNAYLANCGSVDAGLWPAHVGVVNAAYDAARDAGAEVAFPSFQIDTLYGYDHCPRDAGDCFEDNLTRIAAIKRDRFALSTYPYGLQAIKTVAALPADWFTRGADRGPNGPERVVIAEAGWNSRPEVSDLSGTCVVACGGSDAEQQAYLDRLLADAQRRSFDLVTWWSDRDLILAPMMDQSCPIASCAVDATWCALLTGFRGTGTPGEKFFNDVLFKFWGAMGLRAYDGTPKPLLRRWQQARAVPFGP